MSWAAHWCLLFRWCWPWQLLLHDNHFSMTTSRTKTNYRTKLKMLLRKVHPLYLGPNLFTGLEQAWVHSTPSTLCLKQFPSVPLKTADVYEGEEERTFQMKSKKSTSKFPKWSLPPRIEALQPLHFKEVEGGKAISLPSPQPFLGHMSKQIPMAGPNRGAMITKGRPLFPGQWSLRRCQGNLISWTSNPKSWRFRFQHAYFPGGAQRKGKQALPVPAY